MMTRPVVLDSINQAGANRCVDLFRRADGSFGFEEYRRDGEDGRGWFPVGGYAGLVFATLDEARRAAGARVAWLDRASNGAG